MQHCRTSVEHMWNTIWREKALLWKCCLHNTVFGKLSYCRLIIYHFRLNKHQIARGHCLPLQPAMYLKTGRVRLTSVFEQFYCEVYESSHALQPVGFRHPGLSRTELRCVYSRWMCLSRPKHGRLCENLFAPLTSRRYYRLFCGGILGAPCARVNKASSRDWNTAQTQSMHTSSCEESRRLLVAAKSRGGNHFKGGLIAKVLKAGSRGQTTKIKQDLSAKGKAIQATTQLGNMEAFRVLFTLLIVLFVRDLRLW